MSSTNSNTPADITLKLAGPALDPWQQTYKLGWIRRPYDVSAGMLLLFAARWSGPGGMVRDQLELGKVVLSVPARNWERSITLVVELGVLRGYEVVEGNYLQDNDLVIFPRHVLLDGYIILLPGELPIKIYRG